MSLPDPGHLTTLTFDCYGTLIDWEAGAITALRPLLLRHGIGFCRKVGFYFDFVI
jgi:FMN phosphatase YigB (HAD superfamily)